MTKGVFRNRAVTDILEPGSTAKPFTISMVLESGEMGPDTMVDTSPGYYHLAGHTIRDVHNYGEISVFDVVVHSSNVGSAKLALGFPFDDLYHTFEKVGFGSRAASLPGEISGVLTKRTRQIEHATLAYGYGFSATPLQLARAYTVFATDGVLLPVTLQPRKPGHKVTGTRVFQPETVASVRSMLEQVATPNGTARKARIPRYRVGGKTGTTHKLIDGNYVNKRYVSLFAGLAPISDPKFVMVVAIDDPRGKFYYGGDVAAPVFSSLMADLMRLYNVKPDGIDESQVTQVPRQENRV
jgi:cell division protein FtsI (penicillin-binding protein 3)